MRTSVVLLAGSTGRIGSACAQHVLANGGRVAAAVRRPWQVEKLQALLGRENVLVGCVPSGDAEAAAGFVKGAQDALGPISAFVGAAGAWQARAPGREPGGEVAEALAANLLANATLARAVLPGLRRRRSGVLVFLGATDAALANASAAIAASKGAVHAFVRSLAHDLAGSGVQAGAVLLDDAGVGDLPRVVRHLGSLVAVDATAAIAAGALSPLAP